MMLPLFGLALTAQDDSLVHSTFSKDEDGWVVSQPIGTGGKVSVAHEPENVKVGAGSLKIDYLIGQGQIAGATRPVPAGTLAKLGSIHFWARSAVDTPFMMTLQEKDGGAYTAQFTVPKGGWQEVELSVRDFAPSTDVGSPDENGRLDPDQIDAVSLYDLGTFLAQVPALSTLLGIKPGDRSVYLSDVQLSRKSIPDASTLTDAEFLIDNYARPQPAWAVLNASSKVVNEAPLSAPALRLDSNLSSSQAAGAFRRFRLGSLVGKSKLSLRLASAKPCKLIVQLEEAHAGKYNATVSLAGGSKVEDQTVTFSAMTPDEQTKDPNGKLDLDQVGQLTIVDITSFTDAPGSNTLWIGKISAKP